VGSSKSTIARLLKKGMEEYSKTPEGAAYTFAWNHERKGSDGTLHKERMKCPMNEEPLNLIPESGARGSSPTLQDGSDFAIPEGNELCPACRFVFKES
jgi:serine protein kinase